MESMMGSIRAGSSLDEKPHNPPQQKVKRFFQRAKSGLTMARKKREFLSFLTLTSSPESPKDIAHSWEKLKKRMERAFGNIEYIWVRELTKSNLVHMHIIIRGPYIPQKWLSKNWEEIHKAKIVHIEAIWHPEKVVRYMTKYLSKEIIGRFGYSWGWIFRKAAYVWRKTCKYILKSGGSIEDILKVWDQILEYAIGRERERLRENDIQKMMETTVFSHAT